jgi:hypothetical protein
MQQMLEFQFRHGFIQLQRQDRARRGNCPADRIPWLRRGRGDREDGTRHDRSRIVLVAGRCGEIRPQHGREEFEYFVALEVRPVSQVRPAPGAKLGIGQLVHLVPVPGEVSRTDLVHCDEQVR